MDFYKTKCKRLPGTRYKEIYDQAFEAYKKLKKKTKRQPYARSKYFGQQKIFLNLFWIHLKDKVNLKDKARRLKYFLCAIDLIQNCNYPPRTKENSNKSGELLHRFFGMTQNNEYFAVQIKEVKRNDHKFLVSVFPTIKEKRLSARL